MASFSTSSFILLSCFLSLLIVSTHQQQQPELVLNSVEQESVYQVLESINSAIPWRSDFQDDLCSSAPHGVVCDYFSSETGEVSSEPDSVHITELSFGYVSDYSLNPPCSPNSTFNPLLFSSFKYLRKLFFYRCFTGMNVSVPSMESGFGSYLEELVFVENPALFGSLSDIIGNFTNLKRLVLIGNEIYGNIPEGFGALVNLQEMTLSRNRLSGGLSFNLNKLKNLRIIDLSHNAFDGNVPEEMSNLSRLLKLDLSFNGFYGRIPENLSNLQDLEFLDLSFNSFGNFGIPLFLGQMTRLKEVHLSGNKLGGKIPEIWKKLRGISGIGFSKMELVGRIPASMGAYLRNLSYITLDNNKLEGEVPKELGFLEFICEINLENNNLRGSLPFTQNFTARVGQKLKLTGNPELCVDSTSLGKLKICNKPDIIPESVAFNGVFSSSYSSSSSVHFPSPYAVLLTVLTVAFARSRI